MADLDPATFVGEMIAQAFKLAGVNRQNISLTGTQANLGLFLLNNLIAQWSESGYYLFFLSNLYIPAQANVQDYFIGESPIYNVQAAPFQNITSVTYNLGDITYTASYITPKKFNSIVLKNITSFPGWYTYEVQKDYCLLRLYPKTQGGDQIIKVVGKQRLTPVNLFQNLDQFPRYAYTPTLYSLAELIADSEGGELPSDFESKRARAMTILQSAVQIDVEVETADAFMPFMPFGATGGQYG